MCLIIDMNVLPCVFNEENANHANFKPVKDWILSGKGKMVVGGSTYFSELAKLNKIRKFYIALRKAGKAVVVEPAIEIDKLEEKLKEKFEHKDFDDPHIVALLIVSGCQIICSNDARAFRFFQNKGWYPKGSSVPKIYCDKSFNKSKEILNDRNMVNICMPCEKLKKEQIELLSQVAL